MTEVKRVIILGGGVAGLSAAHHLVTKGKGRFQVEIFERRFLGGKARSGLINKFPTEHGFRFFPGFYKHITRTMKEIPIPGGGNVYNNNLVDTELYTFLFSNKCGRLDVPINIGTYFSKLQLGKIKRFFQKLSEQKAAAKVDLKDEGIEKFVNSLLEVYTTCNARIESTYDNISWSEFINAKERFRDYGKDYENLLATGISKNLVAVRADVANSRTGAKLIGHMIWHILSPNAPKADKILNAPTNVAWIDPWRKFLEEKGVIFHKNRRAVSLEFDPRSKQVTGLRHDDVEAAQHQSWSFYQQADIREGLPLKQADYFICAMPIERADELLENSVFKNEKIKSFDHTLDNFKPLWKNTDWMTGVIFYFNTPIDISRGHITIADEDAAVTMISQMQFWSDYLKKEENQIKDEYGREVKAILSVIVSNWEAKSKYTDRKGIILKDLSREEVIEEVKELIFRCEIEPGVFLGDYQKNLVAAFLDDSIVPFNDDLANPRYKEIQRSYNLYNKEPLFINKIESYHLRPTGYTCFKNFYLASDYIKTNADLGCMDSADEAARRAVNNIFERESLRRACKIDPYNLPSLFGLFSTARLLDYRRYHKGLEWKRNRVLVWFYKSLKKILLLSTNRPVKFLLALLWTILFLITAFLNLFYRFALKLNYVKEV